MPLVRLEVRNEYGLGMPELYTETNREDPKSVLDGVAVAGLVGILRQLGDLSEFAADVFHGIQEQVSITSSRSHKLGERVYNIETALPLLEKAILAQRSHLHFAYTHGSQWHTQLQTEQNHFIDSDLPRCIMDSYEDCRDPPRLYKLDKFDTSGRGSCFKRYSDPTYFRRASAGPCGTQLQNVQREKKARRSKKKRSLARHRDMTRDAPVYTHASGMDFAARSSNGKSSPSLDVSEIHVTSISGTEPQEPKMQDHLSSFDSRNGSGYIECIIRPSYSTESEENEAKEPSFDSKVQQNAYLDLGPHHEDSGVLDENVENSNLQENSEPTSSFVTWDEKLEIIESKESEDLSSRVDLIDFNFHDERRAISAIVGGQSDEIQSEMDYYMDALNIVESESETDVHGQTKRSFKSKSDLLENGHQAISPQIAGMSLISFTSADEFKSEKGEIAGMNSGAVASDGLFSSSREPNSESPSSKQIITTFKSPERPLSTAGAHTTLTNPVMFWTNGGLLGLAPSKPPDFGFPTAAGSNSVAERKDDSMQYSSKKCTIEDDCNASSTTTPAIDGHVTTDDPAESIKENGISSSRIFEFSNRLLVNGFRRQISLAGDEKLASSVRSDVPEKTSIHTGYHTSMGKPFGEQFGNGSPLKSPSSPPLQHMTISFQPVGGIVTSKLKLKFLDESNSHEGSVDMFPSFQLVPEPAISLHESDSDSDDGTFCRSSPYASDDCYSHSESDSEEWDSGDSPRIKDDELLESCFAKEPSAPPPPLPPFEWRGVKPRPDVAIDKEETLSESLPCAWDPMLPEPTVPLQPKPAPLKQDHFVETVFCTPYHKQPDEQNLDMQNESNLTTCPKVVDEKEDFLQQIRTKSLNSRRTSTAQSTSMPGGSADVKVATILEKPNAIRQAVGNNDEEEHNWSET